MNKLETIPESENSLPSSPPTRQRLWTWFNLALTAVLFVLGVWYLVTRVSLAEVGKALAAANLWLILLSFGTVLLTLLLKGWRWQLMFPAEIQNERASYLSFLWTLLLGAYINVLVPFLRLGELVRIVALERLTSISKAQSLATLVLEKMLDLIMLGLTVLALLTAVVLPDYLNDRSVTVFTTVAATLTLLILVLIALKTEPILQAMSGIFARLPSALGERLTRWTISGLAGLAALRSGKLALALIGLSAVIAMLALLTPLLLLWAFDLPYGLIEAAILHVALTIALVPPTTPGKIGIFDGVVAFLLLQFGMRNEALIVGFTIIYHLIVVLPLIILGSIAATRTKVPWQQDLK